MKRLPLLIVLLVCLTGPGRAPAQGPGLAVQHLGVGEGLPQGSVYSLYQDKKGFVWIGTGDGLACWDGRTFRTFRGRYNDTSGRVLPARMVRGTMLEDSAGGLWMATSLGIVRYDQWRERFRVLPLPVPFDVERDQILGADKGRLFLRAGKRIYYRSMHPATAWESLSIALPETAQAMILGGRLYIADSAGLATFPLRDGKQLRVLAQNGIQQILPVGDSGIQLLTPQELLFWNGKNVKRYPLPSLMQSQFSARYVTGPASGYGVGATGLIRYDCGAGGLQSFPTRSDPARSLSNVLINVVMPDRSGNLWIGTEGTGLDVLDTKGSKFSGWPPHTPDGRLRELMVKSLCDVAGKLWIGTFDDGIYVLNRANGSAQHIIPPGKGLRRTSLFFRDSDGRIWMNRDGRIGIVDTLTKQFRISAIFPGIRNDNLTAYSMIELASGDYLAGTTFGLHRIFIKNGRISIRELAPGHRATSGIIAALERYADGSIFIGKVRDGFYRIRLADTGIKILDEGLHYTGVRDFQLSPEGRYVWMATEHGLAGYQPERKELRLLDEADGLSNSHIYGIVPDGDTALWLSTNKGLNRLSFRHDAAGGALRDMHVRSYSTKDGLQSNEFNTGAFCRMADGSVAFGGVAGVNWFYPAALRANPHQPPVVLTEISVNEQLLRSDTGYAYLQTIFLPYSQNTLAFQMTALEFTNPAANRYAYKLEGIDKDWVAAGNRGEARYANLPPGRYLFLAKAANGDGIWSSQPAALHITIYPPWWGTITARIAAALALAALLALGIRSYIRRRVAARLRELEKQQAVNEERLRISRDMHDELGTGLTKIALLTQVAQRKSAGTQPASFMEINSTSRQLTQKIGEIVWTLNPQNDTLDTLASYIREWVQEQYDALEGVAVKTDFEEQLPAISLSHSKRQALLLVTKEAVNNAVKYSDAVEIVVRMRMSADAILFEVNDNGRGFAEGERSKGGSGNGLKNMAVRMAAADGCLSIKSIMGDGTSVRYSVLR